MTKFPCSLGRSHKTVLILYLKEKIHKRIKEKTKTKTKTTTK
jgi:hypothetical protein